MRITRDVMESDHSWLEFKWGPSFPKPSRGKDEGVDFRAKEGGKVWVPNLKVAKKEEFATYEKVMSNVMGQWLRDTKVEGASMTLMWDSWKKAMADGMKKGLEWREVVKGGRRARKNDLKGPLGKRVRRIVAQLRSMTAKGKGLETRVSKDGKHIATLRAEKKREVRVVLRAKRSQRMQEVVERGKKGDIRGKWKGLKEWSGVREKAEGGNREWMRTEEGRIVSGEEMAKGWMDTYKAVGDKIEACGGFDDEARSEMVLEVNEWLERGSSSGEVAGGGCKEISVEEVEEMVGSLKEHKAVADEIKVVFVRKGGERVVAAIHMLCCVAFAQEKCPEEWMSVVKVPIGKGGGGESFSDYRGISLMGVVAKVYALVLEKRLRKEVKQLEGLAEEQFGFRPGRGTNGAIFFLSELIKNKAALVKSKDGLCMAFLDITQAFPSVDRELLYFKMFKMGVSAKLIRCVRSLYTHSRVAVKVGGKAEDWFEEKIGLRQGCPLSPLLFLIYINGIVNKFKETGEGVTVQQSRVSCLLFADDIAVFAESRKGLQKLLNAAFEYSRIWRFKFNLGKGKTEVLAKEEKQDSGYLLGGEAVRSTTVYKYLGVMVALQGTKMNKARKNRCLASAKRACWSVYHMGVLCGSIGVLEGVELWKTFVRPCLEYAAGAVSSGGKDEWKEVEVLQRSFFKRVLRVKRSFPDGVLKGDLGLWSERGRRDLLKLRFWAYCIQRKEDVPLVFAMYSCIRNLPRIKDSWCTYVEKLTDELGLREVWLQESVKDFEWSFVSEKLVRQREMKEWVDQMENKRQLGLYMALKKEFAMERFLFEGDRPGWGTILKLRASTSCLRITTGRWESNGVGREDRICQMCNMGKIEDEAHFLCVCEGFSEERKSMFNVIDRLAGVHLAEWSVERLTVWILAGRHKDVVVRKVVMDGVGRMYLKRLKKEAKK